MTPIPTAISLMLLLFLAAPLHAQSPNPTPPPELKKWDIWIGDWALSGTAKDTPTGPEYKVDWSLHERWILGGFFVQVDQIWRGNGQELRSLEILSWDPVKRIHTTSGFSSDGSTWAMTATFENAATIEAGGGNATAIKHGASNARTIEQGIAKGPDGQVTTCHTTWSFSSDRKDSSDQTALSGTQECELNGVRWTAFRVKGTKFTNSR